MNSFWKFWKRKELNLRNELSKFWEWADKTPLEYSKDRGCGEWEMDFPGWLTLGLAIDLTISKLNSCYNYDLANDLIEGLAIDNETELTLDKIERKLNNLSTFVKQVIESNQPEAKWQIAKIIGNNKLDHSEALLVELTSSENDNYVIRIALLNLNKLYPQTAVKIAGKYIGDSDDYLSDLCFEIVNNKISH